LIIPAFLATNLISFLPITLHPNHLEQPFLHVSTLFSSWVSRFYLRKYDQIHLKNSISQTHNSIQSTNIASLNRSCQHLNDLLASCKPFLLFEISSFLAIQSRLNHPLLICVLDFVSFEN
ncbi:12182_t:CDS:1, partial [Dentiscutata erythropus]